MSDIRTIRQRIDPWRGRDGDAERYYVNYWVELIEDDLREYLLSHPGCPSIYKLPKYGKVWYDANANPHVDGIYDDGLRMFIVRRMRDEFTSEKYDPSIGAREVDWCSLIDKVPCTVVGGTCRFDYRGRTYFVERTYCEAARRGIGAYIAFDGTVRFETEASDLTELVLQLIADNKYDDVVPASLFMDCCSDDGSEPKRDDDLPVLTGLFEEGPKGRPEERPDGRGSGNGSDDVGWRLMTPDEIEAMSREAAAETSLPVSRWTKAQVMDTCRAAGVPEDALSVLRRIPLDDIRSMFLVRGDTDITGNTYDSSQQRHTRFWTLDIEAISRLGQPRTLDGFTRSPKHRGRRWLRSARRH